MAYNECHCPPLERLGREDSQKGGEARRTILSHIRKSFGRKEVEMIPLVFLVILFAQPIYEVEEVVVTATRYPAVLKDVALATVVIDKKVIEDVHPASLGEVLQAYAGIDIKNYGTPGSVSSIFIRGIPSNGTLILLNGHLLNSITTGMADLSAININTVERIEIVKGPVSSLYGANALGGVVNIITTKDYEKPELELKITPSTTSLKKPLRSKELFLKTGLPFRNAHIHIAGAYNASDGFRSNSDNRAYHFQGGITYQNAKLNIGSSLTYNDKDFGLPGPMPLVDSLHSVPTFGDSTATSLFDREEDKNTLSDVNIKWNISEELKWHNTLFADRKLIQFQTSYLDWVTGDTVTEDYDYLVHTFGLNTMAAVDIKETEIIFGIDTRYDTLETTKNSEQTGDTIWHASSYNIGSWIELKKSFYNLKFTPSVRFDRNSEFGNFLSPGLGIVTSLMPALWVKFSIGKAFRAPTFNDLYWPNSGNLDLKPEHGWAYEVRFESSPKHTLFAALSFFMRNIRDRIFWLPAESGMWQPQNVNYLSIKGLDIEIQNRVSDVMDVYIEGTYLYSTQKNDEIVYDFYDWGADTGLTVIEEIERDAAFTPKYTISSKINFNFPYELNFNINGVLVAERFNYYANYDDYPNVTVDTKILDSYFIFNTTISKKILGYLTLSIGVKNLLDTEYATQFGNSIDDLDYPMPGRTFFARLTLRQ